MHRSTLPQKEQAADMHVPFLTQAHTKSLWPRLSDRGICPQPHVPTLVLPWPYRSHVHTDKPSARRKQFGKCRRKLRPLYAECAGMHFGEELQGLFHTQSVWIDRI